MSELQKLRDREIACVFQDPMPSLNPVFTVGQQICEPLMKHLGLGARAAMARAVDGLTAQGLDLGHHLRHVDVIFKRALGEV